MAGAAFIFQGHSFKERFHTFSGVQGLGVNVQWFRGGLVFKAHRLVYHSTLGSRVIKKKFKV